MNKKWIIVLSLMVFIYLVCFLLKSFSFPGILTSYVNDFLSLPIVLTLLLVILRKFKNNSEYMLSYTMIFFAFLYQTTIFEFILPNISERYTYDVWDIVAYAVGGVFFLLIQNRIERKIDF